MFLALRDLRFAKGRFSLIVTVVALMTLLVGFLTGLTGGLAMQNISALLKLDPDAVVFSVGDGEDASYSRSTVSADQAAQWAAADGVESVTPLGVSSVLLESADSDAPVAVLAAPEGSVPQVPASATGITLGETTAADLGVGVGDRVTLTGTELTVGDVVPDEYYSHQQVAWTGLDAWHDYRTATHQPESYASVLLVDAAGGAGALDTGAIDAGAVDAHAGTVTEALVPSLLALDAFRSEIGSLGMIIGMLVVISVLVIGVFFLVWSMQRQRDIAVLKAIGADTSWLARDALGQAFLVLALGAGIGILATLGLGALAAKVLPFALTPLTVLAPPLGMVLAGLLGALVSLRQITRVDPNTALASAAA